MADPMIAFKKQVRELWLSEMTIEERLAGLDPKEVVKHLSTQQLIDSSTPEKF